MHEREEGDSVETRLLCRSSWAGSVGERLRQGRWSPWDFSLALAFWKEKVKAGMLWSLVLGTGCVCVSPSQDPIGSQAEVGVELLYTLLRWALKDFDFFWGTEKWSSFVKGTDEGTPQVSIGRQPS